MTQFSVKSSFANTSFTPVSMDVSKQLFVCVPDAGLSAVHVHFECVDQTLVSQGSRYAGQRIQYDLRADLRICTNASEMSSTCCRATLWIEKAFHCQRANRSGANPKNKNKIQVNVRRFMERTHCWVRSLTFAFPKIAMRRKRFFASDRT